MLGRTGTHHTSTVSPQNVISNPVEGLWFIVFWEISNSAGPDALGQQPVDFFQELAFAASPLEKRTRHDSEFGARVFDLSNGSAKKVKIKVFLLPIEPNSRGIGVNRLTVAPFLPCIYESGPVLPVGCPLSELVVSHYRNHSCSERSMAKHQVFVHPMTFPFL